MESVQKWVSLHLLMSQTHNLSYCALSSYVFRYKFDKQVNLFIIKLYFNCFREQRIVSNNELLWKAKEI